MNKRMRKKRGSVTRARKRERWFLVHQAGCVCCESPFLDEEIRTDPEFALVQGTRVPRSMRSVFGFRVAP